MALYKCRIMQYIFALYCKRLYNPLTDYKPHRAKRMKVQKSKVSKLLLAGLDGLDPITVIYEDYELGKGKIIIESGCDTWAHYWGAMGERRLAEFFCKCSADYIAHKLSNGDREQYQSDITDFQAIPALVRKEAIKLRRAREIDAAAAREAYSQADWLDDQDSLLVYDHIMVSVFGDDWWHCLPTKENPNYAYLCRIVSAVQMGLKQAELLEVAA
jgi:hypothetical protein